MSIENRIGRLEASSGGPAAATEILAAWASDRGHVPDLRAIRAAVRLGGSYAVAGPWGEALLRVGSDGTLFVREYVDADR